MNKPTGYDDIKVGGDFTPAELGGHHMIIKGVREEKSKNGNDMIVVAFDFAPEDRQPNYFSNLFEKDIRPDKKWPYNGTKYIVTMDSTTGKASKAFKGFITSFERSNGVEAEWGKKFCEQFKGKRIGGVFGVVEEEYNGEIKKRHKIRWFCEDAKADTQKIPDEQLLQTPVTAPNPTQVPEGIPEEIPF